MGLRETPTDPGGENYGTHVAVFLSPRERRIMRNNTSLSGFLNRGSFKYVSKTKVRNRVFHIGDKAEQGMHLRAGEVLKS